MSDKIVNEAEQIVTLEGIESLNVCAILKKLNITNRVFYNRFNNIEEVLELVYQKIVLKLREIINSPYDGKQDFFEYITEMVIKTLEVSYDLKMKFNLYVFDNDSITDNNYLWYTTRIKELFEYAKTKSLIKDVNVESLSYAFWCFCRGYNADAVNRFNKDEAIEKFKYSFQYILEGIKK